MGTKAQFSEMDSTLRQITRKLFMLIYIRNLCYLLTAAFLITGSITLIATLSLHRSGIFQFILITSSIFIIFIINAFISIRQMPSKAKMLSLLDLHSSNCGGLICAKSEEFELGSWQNKITNLTSPQIRLVPNRKVWLLPFSVMFLLASCLVPSVENRTKETPPLDISHEIEVIEERIELLEEEEFMPKQEAEELAKELSKLEENAKGDNPLKTFEALNHLHEKTQNNIIEAQHLTAEQLQNIANLNQISEMVKQQSEAGRISQEEMQEMMQALNQAHQKMNKNAPNSESLKQLMEQLGISQQEQQELAEQLQKMCNGKKSVTVSQQSLKELKEFLEKNCENSGKCFYTLMTNAENDMIDFSEYPGTGEGFAMEFKDRDISSNTNFSNITSLPPSPDEADSEFLDYQYSEPEANKQETAVESGNFVDPDATKEHSESQLQPRHKQIVQDYFSDK